eukprot:TRINITY_DN9044_c0_g2_i3.p1 TRINITY_DN9044_c0_g2~~TRINITY_DN9044_c0_g2_i3.p1  ORF type:complete len:168 (+),score=33.10 TRINITY_DN9044_c0_g2_i3:584-1087(+)
MAFFKSVPFFSQVISFAQAVAGDLDGAKNTQVQFSKRCPVVSQVRSAFEACSGDPEAAKETQEEFSKTCPIIAQARSAVEAGLGDSEAAAKTQKEFLKANVWEPQQTDNMIVEPREMVHPTMREASVEDLLECDVCLVCMDAKKEMTFVHGDTGLCRQQIERVIRQY